MFTFYKLEKWGQNCRKLVEKGEGHLENVLKIQEGRLEDDGTLKICFAPFIGLKKQFFLVKI